MFDDQPKVNGEPPVNLPSEPADMFDKVDGEEAPAPLPNALNSGLLKKKSASEMKEEADAVQMLQFGAKEKKPILGKIIFGLVLVGILSGAGYAGWWAYGKIKGGNGVFSLGFNGKLPKNPLPQNTNPPSQNNESNTGAPTSSRNKNDAILFGENSTDSDNDDLSDTEEKQIGTDSNDPDSDGDLLSDGDEKKVWRTDPLKIDSDNDSYADGEEIANGYNPLGGGKYQNPPLGIVRFVTSSVDQSGISYDILVIKGAAK